MLLHYFIFLTEVLDFSNLDLDSIVTLLNVSLFGRLLRESNYPIKDADFLIKGFSEGFDIGYAGPMDRQSTAKNIPFTVGDKYDMWNKIMREVQAKRVAGPFEEIPYQNFIQSPIGLVPKSGNCTRLIFHLSYQFKSGKVTESINACTPRDICSVRYNDLDSAMSACFAGQY